MGAVTHRITDLPARRRRRRVQPLLSRVGFILMVWLPVVVVESRNLPNRSVLAPLVAPMELTVWVMAILVTVWAVHRDGRGRRVVAGCLLLLTLLCTHFTNWGALHPSSYYATHRYAFDAVAAQTRGGTLGAADGPRG